MTPDELFGDVKKARRIFDALAKEVSRFGKVSVRVSKSQIAFRRKKNVAVVWMPGMYLKHSGAPLVLTLSFAEKDSSPRWKEIVRVSANRFTHHLELHQVKDIDSQVKGWLHAAWEAAG
jgi:predicted transport protein